VKTAGITLRQKVALELGTLAILATIFLLLFPRRNPCVDVALALFALLGIGATARYTKDNIWAASNPTSIPKPIQRLHQSDPLDHHSNRLSIFLIGGIPGVPQRRLVRRRRTHPRLENPGGVHRLYRLGTDSTNPFPILSPWPAARPLSKKPTRLADPDYRPRFSLLHLPDVWTSLVTAVAGPIWTLIYYRYVVCCPWQFPTRHSAPHFTMASAAMILPGMDSGGSRY